MFLKCFRLFGIVFTNFHDTFPYEQSNFFQKKKPNVSRIVLRIFCIENFGPLAQFSFRYTLFLWPIFLNIWMISRLERSLLWVFWALWVAPLLFVVLGLTYLKMTFNDTSLTLHTPFLPTLLTVRFCISSKRILETRSSRITKLHKLCAESPFEESNYRNSMLTQISRI